MSIFNHKLGNLFIVILITLIFTMINTFKLHLPGLQYDDAISAAAAIEDVKNPQVSVKIFGRDSLCPTNRPTQSWNTESES